MQAEQIKCPCCGQLTKQREPMVVDYEENVLRYRAQSVSTTPRLLKLAHILAKRMPETVPQGLIVEKMWGDAEGDYAETNVKVGVTQLRKVIRPLGLDIVNTWGVGYRMVEMLRTERSTGIKTRTRNHWRFSSITTIGIDDKIEKELGNAQA